MLASHLSNRVFSHDYRTKYRSFASSPREWLCRGYADRRVVDPGDCLGVAGAVRCDRNRYESTLRSARVPGKIIRDLLLSSKAGGVGTTRGPIPVSINKPEKRRKSVLPALL